MRLWEPLPHHHLCAWEASQKHPSDKPWRVMGEFGACCHIGLWCMSQMINRTAMCGNAASSRWEQGVGATGHSLRRDKGYICQKLRRNMYVLPHDEPTTPVFLPRKWPLTLEGQLQFSWEDGSRETGHAGTKECRRAHGQSVTHPLEEPGGGAQEKSRSA